MESGTLTALTLVVVLLLLPTLFLLRRPPHRRLPPSPPSLPLLGHLHLLSSMPHHSLAALAARHGPLLRLRLGRIPALVISSPRLARAALTSLDAALASRPCLLSARYLSFGCSDITFSPSGPYHRQARRIAVTELLSPRRIAAFRPIRLQEIRRLLSAVVSSSPAPIDMSARFLALANDVLCRVAFGRRFAVGDRLPEVLAEAQQLFAGFTPGDFYPELEWVIGEVTGLRRRLEKCRGYLSAVGDEIIGEHVARRHAPEGEEEVDDFVDVLLRVQELPELEVPLTDDNVKALVLDMFVAGTDTTSATLEWAMTELARHPAILKKAQEEIRKIMGSQGNVEENQLQKMHCMKTIIKETLRLHPPVPLLVPRESIAPCTIDSYDVPPGTRIFINTYAMNRDPRNWDDPLEFKPERFDDAESIDLKGQDFEQLLPFGGGRRGCPGYSFALATIEATLASLLYHFDWELPQGVGAEDVDLSEIFGLATRKKEPLVLVAKASKGISLR